MLRQTTQTNPVTALYARLSKDDELIIRCRWQFKIRNEIIALFAVCTTHFLE